MISYQIAAGGGDLAVDGDRWRRWPAMMACDASCDRLLATAGPIALARLLATLAAGGRWVAAGDRWGPFLLACGGRSSCLQCQPQPQSPVF